MGMAISRDIRRYRALPDPPDAVKDTAHDWDQESAPAQAGEHAAAAQADKSRAWERKRRAAERAAAIVARREEDAQQEAADDEEEEQEEEEAAQHGDIGGDDQAADVGAASASRPEADAAAVQDDRCCPRVTSVQRLPVSCYFVLAGQCVSSHVCMQIHTSLPG